MKWRFAIGGGILGLVWMVIALVRAYAAAPSMPGPFELVIQLFMLAVCTICGAAGGFILGCAADLVFRKDKTHGKERPGAEAE
ncbi:MAG: hypothetical protein ABFE13_01415 [Phycisphaerales bacterium]